MKNVTPIQEPDGPAREITTTTIVIDFDGPRSPWTKDEQDRMWLGDHARTIEKGLKDAADAAVAIAKNWTAGRKVSRFHEGMTAFEYLIDEIGAIRLAKDERDAFLVSLVTEGSMSRRQSAKLAGVSEFTARGAINIAPKHETPKPGRPRKPRPEPTVADVLTKAINGILTGRATLPSDLDTWLKTGPAEDDRIRIDKALVELIARASGLLDTVRTATEGDPR